MQPTTGFASVPSSCRLLPSKKVENWAPPKDQTANKAVWLKFQPGLKFTMYTVIRPLGPDYMSQATLVCRDDFLAGITWGEPARLMADAMNHRRPERVWFWCDEGLMSRAGPANVNTQLHEKISARLAGIPGSQLTGLARLSCNREVYFYDI